MCDSHRPLEGADSEPRDAAIDAMVADGYPEDVAREALDGMTHTPVDRMIEEWLPDATRRLTWRDRIANGGWDHPRDSEPVEAES